MRANACIWRKGNAWSGKQWVTDCRRNIVVPSARRDPLQQGYKYCPFCGGYLQIYKTPDVEPPKPWPRDA